jgi:hypothetical protein
LRASANSPGTSAAERVETHLARAAMPGFPGAATISRTRGL